MQAPVPAPTADEMNPSSPSIESFNLEDQDESVRIAVRALGAMRNGGPNNINMSQSQSQDSITYDGAASQPTPALSIASSSTSTSLPSPSLSAVTDIDSPDFASRMSQMPLVSSVLSVYESGKNSSRVMKYGARMMESSLQTISKPMINRLPVDVNQLDEFACRQLDRIERYRRPSELEKMQLDERDDVSRDESAVAEDEDGGSWSSGLETSVSSAHSRSIKGKERPAADIPAVLPPPAPPETKGDSIQVFKDDDEKTPGEQNSQQVAQRSRWQAMLLEAGGISAALSEESMRRLKYCLQWLQYATAHIDAQILVLRDFTASLQQSTNNPSALISPAHMRQLNHVRKDVVQTIRQVVDVVSKYAGGALPEPARSRVRGFILHLPQRWASAANSKEGVKAGAGSGAGVGGVPVPSGSRRSRYQHHRERGAGAASSISSSASASQPGTPSSSRPASPLSSPRLVPRRELQAHGHGHGHPSANGAAGAETTAGAATQAAQRILTLSTESLDMMRGVMGVVKESLDRADAWVERLRVVGLQRGQQPGAETIQSQPSSAHRGPPGPLLSPALSDVNLHFDYGFPSPPPGPGTPWSSFASSAPPTPGMDAPSPGMSHELGGLTIGEGAEVATPKTGLQSLPEEKEEEAVEAGAKDDQKVDVANTPVPGPGQAKMDVDA